MADNRWVVCPFCGMNRKLIKSGVESKKPLNIVKRSLRFNVVDPETGVFIDFRDISGGRGSGFKRIKSIPLIRVKNDPIYKNLIDQLKEHCKKIINILEFK